MAWLGYMNAIECSARPACHQQMLLKLLIHTFEKHISYDISKKTRCVIAIEWQFYQLARAKHLFMRMLLGGLDKKGLFFPPD